MTLSTNTTVTYIGHSPLLFVPILGDVIYKAQIHFYKLGVIKNIWISRKINENRTDLLNLVSRKSDFAVINSYKFGRHLSILKCKIISNFEVPESFKKFNLNRLHDVSWTIILSYGVTEKTKKSLKSFLPRNITVVSI